MARPPIAHRRGAGMCRRTHAPPAHTPGHTCPHTRAQVHTHSCTHHPHTCTSTHTHGRTLMHTLHMHEHTTHVDAHVSHPWTQAPRSFSLQQVNAKVKQPLCIETTKRAEISKINGNRRSRAFLCGRARSVLLSRRHFPLCSAPPLTLTLALEAALGLTSISFLLLSLLG